MVRGLFLMPRGPAPMLRGLFLMLGGPAPMLRGLFLMLRGPFPMLRGLFLMLWGRSAWSWVRPRSAFDAKSRRCYLLCTHRTGTTKAEHD